MESQKIVRSPEEILKIGRANLGGDYVIVPPKIRRLHLNRDLIIGLIGDRGGGKSLGGGYIALRDFMLQGDPCYSNMDINAAIELSDLDNVICRTESKPLNMQRFLTFDPEYTDCVIFIDEINIALADARRSMTNQNLAADDVGQQLRKLRSALIYTCIHEMFVDSRIRDMTDIFIHTEDLALTPNGMSNRMPQGENFEWSIYDMSGKWRGERYGKTGNVGHTIINGKMLWGLVDTWQRQDRRKYSLSTQNIEQDIESSEPVKDRELSAPVNKWEWLHRAVIELHQQLQAQNRMRIHSYELWDYIQPEAFGVGKAQAGTELRRIGIYKRQASANVGGAYYHFDKFNPDSLAVAVCC